MFEIFAKILAYCYELVPNYAVAIIMMTAIMMIITAPLTLKGTRSMIKMQLIQPQLKKIQNQYKDDRQKLNEELMKFYQEEGINPVGGCLPLIAQAPIFFILYHVLQGVTRVSAEGHFDPEYLDKGTKLYRDLVSNDHMVSFGLDLSRSFTTAWKIGFTTGLPYLILILVMAGANLLQTYQISLRTKGADIPQQQKVIQWLFPVIFPFISLRFPAAMVVYWITQSVFRIGLQYYITRSLYHGEDSLGKQAQQVSAQARKEKAAEKSGVQTRPAGASRPRTAPVPKPTTNGNGSGNGAKDLPAAQAVSGSHSRSKKKKKRR